MFNCMGKKLRDVIHNINPTIEKYSEYALQLTDIARKYVSGDIGTLVAGVTGSWGADMQAKVSTALDKATADIGIVQGEAGKDLATQLTDLAQAVLSKTSFAKNGDLIKVAARIVAHLDDDTQPEHFYDTVVQGASLK